jgi:hypothetical protein
MKNIHLLPTDKPSRIYLIKSNNRLGISSDNPECTKNFGNGTTQNQHIYITSSSEIKEGDWCLLDNNVGISNILIFQSLLFYTGRCKKIILTTDQDLINDGVQAIDDDFLEWFVNNPSFEEVKVADLWKEGNPAAHDSYQIIIPKDEPKQETLEEAAERYSKRSSASVFQEAHKRDFIAGGNFQAERMYSEEEVLQLLRKAHFVQQNIEEWFEQFKKKQNENI